VVQDARPCTETWLGIGLAVALGAVAALGVGLVALAREVGELRLAIAPQAALSIAEEGPELGSHVRVIDRFSRDAPLAVAVFTSPGCALCRALEPSLRLVASDPEVELEIFDEQSDPAAWDELAVPGSPYAVVLSADGPHPTGLPRVDRTGFPLRAADDHAVDDLGRPIDKAGRPVDSRGHVLLDPDGNPLPPAPRTRVCQAAARAHDFRAYHDGSWY